MNSFLKTRKIVWVVAVILFIFVFGYWFFYSTVRGSSAAMYVFGGWGAPLSTKFSCAKKADSRVSEKFMLPLNFDKESKDSLKNFWHYSYYRECLYNDGYDFSGEKVPASTVNNDGSVWTYSNKLTGVQFTLEEPVTILADNLLNVDFDSQLYASEIKVGDISLHLRSYTDYEAKSLSELLDPQKRIRLLNASMAIGAQLVTYKGGENVREALWVNNEDGSIGTVFRKANGDVVYFSANPKAQKTLEKIVETINLSE